MFHIAPCFFPGKEALLIIIDEIKRRSISENLKERIAEYKQNQMGHKMDDKYEDNQAKNLSDMVST